MAIERNIIAIGGGGFGRNPGEGIIEEYILKQTRKKKPISALYQLLPEITTHIKLIIMRLFQI